MTAATKMTLQEYIDFERPANEKHDYIDGRAVLRVGAEKFLHNARASQVLMAFYAALDAARSRCTLLGSDMKVYVSDNTRLYPDLSIRGPQTTFDDMDTMHNPLVIIEIVNDTTRDDDKNDKFVRYQQIPLLRHYVLIECDRVEVIYHEKQNDGI